MKRRAFVLEVVLILALALPAFAAKYTFTSFDYPDAPSTFAYGINNRGQIVGSYIDLNFPPYLQRGFIKVGDTFTSFDYPSLGTFDTWAMDINNSGQIVGYSGPWIGWRYGIDPYGFLRDRATYTFIGYGVEAMGINDSKKIIGNAFLGSAPILGPFLKEGTTYTPLDFLPVGINNRGEIVGTDDVNGIIKDGDTETSFGYPGATYTHPCDINNRGQIVGVYNDGSSCHGFFKEDDTYTPIDYPDAESTEAYGINDRGEIVGYYLDGTGYHGFLARPVHTFKDILDFYDSSVNKGVLSGVGPNPRASSNKLWAVRNMIVQAKVYEEAGYNDLASDQLQDAYKKTDGLDDPPDSVSGQAAGQLASMILGLKASLGSP